MADSTWIYWAIFIVYIIFLLAMGIQSKKKTSTLSDYLVAGRSIGPILLGLSVGVTYFSASLLVGSGPFGARWGLSVVWIGVINAVVGIGLNMVIFGDRTRALSQEIECLTVPELLGKRYQSKSVQKLVAIITFVFEIVYLVAVYMGLSTLFSVIMPNTNNAYIIAVMICGIITIAYLTTGGSHGAIVTDVFESIIMLVGVVLIFVIGLNRVNGFTGMNSILENYNPEFTEFPGAGGFTVIGIIIVSSVGIWGSPQMISRYFTAKDRRSTKWSLVISLSWGLVIATLAYINANIGFAFLLENPDPNLSVGADNLIPVFMLDIMNPWLAAIFIACVTAASLTTGEKIILVATSAISRDVYQLNTDASDEKTMKITKISTVVVVVAAVGIAMLQPAAILALTFFAFSSMASVVLVPYIYGLYWKKGTAKAAFITGLVCAIINIAWWFCISGSSAKLLSGVFPLFPDVAAFKLFNLGNMEITLGSINEFIPAQMVAMILFPLISKYTQPPEKEFVDNIFASMKSKTD